MKQTAHLSSRGGLFPAKDCLIKSLVQRIAPRIQSRRRADVVRASEGGETVVLIKAVFMELSTYALALLRQNAEFAPTEPQLGDEASFAFLHTTLRSEARALRRPQPGIVPRSNYTNKSSSVFVGHRWKSLMHVSRIKASVLARNATGAISKGAQGALPVCGLLEIASALPVSVGTIASPNSIGSNAAQSPRTQTDGTAYPGMAWIPGGTFLMGTDDKESFPNERPAHFVQIQGFWMDEDDVTNAEFAKVAEATADWRSI